MYFSIFGKNDVSFIYSEFMIIISGHPDLGFRQLVLRRQVRVERCNQHQIKAKDSVDAAQRNVCTQTRKFCCILPKI